MPVSRRIVALVLLVASAIYMVTGYTQRTTAKTLHAEAHLLVGKAAAWFDVVVGADLTDAQARHDATALRDAAFRAVDHIEEIS